MNKKFIGPYKIWKIPKRNGKFRTIESPNTQLKEQQRELLKNGITEIKRVSPFAHAFQPYKNIVTMAIPHVKKNWLVCLDIEDFFPSIKQKPCEEFLTTPDSSICFYDFKDGKGFRLPQGAPTSPVISNLYLSTFDWRMAWLCNRFKCNYSRYADDLVISGSAFKKIKKLAGIAESLLKKYYNLKINKEKVKYMHRNKRQMVCGVVVNEKLNIPKKRRKNLRAEIYQQGKNKLHEDTKGRISFHKMVINNKKTTNSSMEILKHMKIIKELSK